LPAEKHTVLVLRHADFSESSRMLTLLSPDRGRFSAAAKGCRRPKSALRPLTELFTLSQALFSRSRDSYILTGGSLVDSFYDLRLDYDALSAASLCAEITSAVAQENVPQPELFFLVARCLGLLSHEKTPPKKTALYFCLQLLALEGFRPALEACVRCGAAPGGAPSFSVSEGGVLCPGCRSLALDARSVSPGLVSTLRHLLRLSADELPMFALNAPLEEPLLDLAEALLKSRLDRPYSLHWK